MWFESSDVEAKVIDRFLSLCTMYDGSQMAMAKRAAAQQQLAMTAPPIATQCFLLANMFDPTADHTEWNYQKQPMVFL